jgi:mediator of RNA polymerase II transcription subunit 14
VATTIVEQQLKDRSIPFAQQFPSTSGPGAAQSRSAVAGLVPTIVVNVKDLLKDDKAADVAMPKVYMQIKDWWHGGKCQVSYALLSVVRLRTRS